MISEVEEKLNELTEEVSKVLDKISDVEGTWREAVLVMKDRSLDDPTVRTL
jgi:hypothetical protein